ncbi:hypothetical protein BGW38_000070 [Lunasporangiospora selenospora]|uniref:Protein kinase domain-containing protein n=1 Tax=Lunasporangiospora selenospora TaxID=979761 RepID=A0A9P6G2N1_9FUNG|nr:hypothetical protein BGW38_000070 [Lunasporangiospora selenospora]
MKIQWSDLKRFDIIGSGSFGRVFHGDLLGTEVAIKECVRSDSRAFDEKYFKREVDILKQSRHPNIVQFMGICRRKKRFYIITEFLPLGNLRRWIQDGTKEFGWDTRISFAIDISLALAYLHHKNIIHRDLKGENLLISENMRIKVCDFGFSRLEARDEDEMRRISYCGTDGYMAPEILLGEDFDCSVDVFSFGIVLAEMMARHVVDAQHFVRIPPDMGVSTDEILFRAEDGCPIELGELAIHCVHPLPEHRPKLRHIVERLTAIENVDVHVGTTLVVAPSVARAARNMMRKKEIEATMTRGDRQHQPNYPPTAGVQDPQENPLHSSMIVDGRDSVFVGSHSTFKGRRLNDMVNNGVNGSTGGSSAIPLVYGERYENLRAKREERQTSGSDKDTTFSTVVPSDGYEGSVEFKMPLWDSIQSPRNMDDLQRWNEELSEHHSTSTILARQMDERQTPRKAQHQHRQDIFSEDAGLSHLSSIRIDIDDNDDDHDQALYDLDNESSDEDDNDLFEEDELDMEDGTLDPEGREMGHGRHYSLSSDSCGSSLSGHSLTDSVVMALDTLEIPDLLMERISDTPSPVPLHYHHPQKPTGLEQRQYDVKNLPSPSSSIENGSRDFEQGQDSNEPFKRPGLVLRLLPPIPASNNPWITTSTVHQTATTAVHVGEADKDSYIEGERDQDIESQTIPQDMTWPESINGQALSRAKALAASAPPTPPSKSGLLFRSNTVAGGVTHSGKEKGLSRTRTQYQAAPAVLTQEPLSFEEPHDQDSPLLHHPLPPLPASNAEEKEQDGQGRDTIVQTGGKAGRGLGQLVRGMSDSALDQPATQSPEATTPVRGMTITETILATVVGGNGVAGSKPWTNGTGTSNTGGIGNWFGLYNGPKHSNGDSSYDQNGDHPPGPMDAKQKLKKHLSLKEGKQAATWIYGRLPKPHKQPHLQRPDKKEMYLTYPLPESSPRLGAAARVKESFQNLLPEGGEEEEDFLEESEGSGESFWSKTPVVKRRRSTRQGTGAQDPLMEKSAGLSVQDRPLTGLSHRFSLVVLSAQLMPNKCDIVDTGFIQSVLTV